MLELGTGWLPIIPLLFHLAGARHLVLTDMERLMDSRTTATAREVVREHLPMVATGLDRDEAHLLSRLDQDFTFDYLVPWNSRTHPPASTDIIYSRAVLEHVPQPSSSGCSWISLGFFALVAGCVTSSTTAITGNIRTRR